MVMRMILIYKQPWVCQLKERTTIKINKKIVKRKTVRLRMRDAIGSTVLEELYGIQ